MDSRFRTRLFLRDFAWILVGGAGAVAFACTMASMGDDSISAQRRYSQHRVVGDARFFGARAVSVLRCGAANLFFDPAEGSGSGGCGDVGAQLDGVSHPGGDNCGRGVVASVSGEFCGAWEHRARSSAGMMLRNPGLNRRGGRDLRHPLRLLYKPEAKQILRPADPTDVVRWAPSLRGSG